MPGISIGVVGGGASAVCLLDALAQAAVTGGRVTVFEPSADLWRGRAYQIDSKVLKVNTTPGEMSVRANDPHHFERWLDTRERVALVGGSVDVYSGARFAPRTVYGQYLEQTAYSALSELRHKGWRVDLVGAGVTAGRRGANHVELSTAGSRARRFDYVVLCVGGAGPEDVYGLTSVPGFVADPYPASRELRDIDERDDVAVIGSGLTAVDVVLYLAAYGHLGRISLLSRRGVLPSVRQQPAELKLRHLTRDRVRLLSGRHPELSIEDIAALVRAELEDADADPSALHRELAAPDSEPPVQRLRRQFAEVDSADLGLRILQRAIPEIGPDVWPRLREQDQVTVLRRHCRTVMSLCGPMPPAAAAVLLGLIGEGRLELRPGLRRIAPHSGGGFEITCADGAKRRADRVVNAVSTGRGRIPAAARPLVSTLIRGHAARLHPYGGLRLARSTSALVTGGDPDPRLYGLGDIGAGSLFFTFGVPSLVDRGVDIVASILRHAEATRNSQTCLRNEEF